MVVSTRTDTGLIAHLLRRAGFGGTREEIEAYAEMGYEAAVDELIDPTDAGWAGSYMARRFHHEQSGMLTPQGGPSQWLYRMITTRAPLHEKVALFWHGIFATGYPKVIHGKALSDQIRMFRRYGMGRFDTLLLELAKRPRHDRVAGQPGQPRWRHQRELGSGAARAFLPGCGQLQRGGHQGVRARVHRMDARQHRVHGAALHARLGLAVRPDLMALRVPATRPRQW